ncbi:hypothetical protein B0H13DRAFT_2350390 [Mycena leptocephala]|nr:hypothetical protein B0H13DRAFT_2350390 [Mycena leptocephala]
MSNYTIDPHSFENYYYTALLPTFGTCTQLLLHPPSSGFDTTYLLRTSIRPSRDWLVVTTCAMAVFAALHLALQIAITVLSWRVFYLGVPGDAAVAARALLSRGTVLDVVDDCLLIANNIVTDGLFIHRCYLIWGRNIKVVIIPALSLVSSTVMGFVGAFRPDDPSRSDDTYYRLAFGMTILTNLMLMALTAGRIWWIRRDVVAVIEPSVTRTYDTVIAMILESGAIYCVSIILYLALASLNKLVSSPVISVFRAAVPQIMNIAPILIIARVGSGRSVGDETSSSAVLDSRSFARASFTANRNPNWRVPNGATLAYPLGSRTTGSELLRL